MNENFTISVDDDVQIPGLDNMPTYPYWASHRRKIEAMQVGDSFFVPGSDSEKLQSFVDYAAQMGHLLLPRDTVNDEIYLQPGVRVWRVSQAQLDTIRARDAEAGKQTPHPMTAARTAIHRWWKNPKTGKIIQVLPNAGPPPEGSWFKVTEEMYVEQQRKIAAEDDEL